jgi:hypothetical protein
MFAERERGPLGTLVNRWVPRGLLGPSVPTDRHDRLSCLSFYLSVSGLFRFHCTNCHLSSGYAGGPRNSMCNGPLAYPAEDVGTFVCRVGVITRFCLPLWLGWSQIDYLIILLNS